MKKLNSVFFALLLICVFHSPLSAQLPGGLVFRSYDTIQDERTSVTIPAEGGKLVLRKSMSLDFDIRLRSGADRFGYIARIIIGGETNIDVIINNPSNELSYIGVIKDKSFLSKIHPENNIVELDEWNGIRLELIADGDKLTIKESGSVIGSGLPLPKDRSVSIHFGANTLPGYATTDVAPIILRNIEIKGVQGREQYSWPLMIPPPGVDVVPDESGRMKAAVLNADWVSSSHMYWKKVRTESFDSKVFLVTDQDNGEVYIVSSDTVCRYDPVDDSMVKYRFGPELPVRTLSDQFLFHPLRNQIVLYDFEQPEDRVLSFFDTDKKEWTVPVERRREPANLHHSKLFSPPDSSIVQLFGYGFHKYRNDIHRITAGGTVISGNLPEDVFPRYLSAVGVADTVAYIYGGVGNELGLQEYGIHIYSDLYRMDLRDYSIERIAGTDPQAYEAVASSLIVEDGGKSAKGLFFTPRKYQSYLVLKEIDLDTGVAKYYADTISYFFKDTESDADLVFNRKSNAYHAVTSHKTADNKFEVDIYSIAYPALPLPEPPGDRGKMNIWILAAAACALAAGLILIFRKRKQPAKQNTAGTAAEENTIIDVSAMPAEKKKTGIYLLSGFEIIDVSGKDISGEFTPIMRQLLSLIILYSGRNGKGISNIKLKEFLWFDKSEESSRNNRGVHISKIRILLESVGGYQITSENGYWKFIPGDNDFCDYIYALKATESIREGEHAGEKELNTALKISSWGELLPNLQFDFLDGFKSDYSDSVIAVLSSLLKNKEIAGDHNMRIRLADGIMRFDSLDENAVKEKCRSLIALKRIGAAHSTFDKFIREYEQIMGSPYGVTFDNFIKQ